MNISAPRHANLLALEALHDEADHLSIDEIYERLRVVFTGVAVRSPFFDPGMFVYRARRIGADFSFSNSIRIPDLSYPPPDKARPGRANRAGKPMFYCSTGKEPLFFETGELNGGDELIVTSWQARSRMLVNNIGYTQIVFDELGAKRKCPNWEEDAVGGKATISIPSGGAEALAASLPEGTNDALLVEISKLFMRDDLRQGWSDYALTAAIAEIHLGKLGDGSHPFAGVLYPSVRMWANGDNLALTPDFVDANLAFKRATRVRIDKREDQKFEVTHLDCAREVDERGNLRWLGRLPKWQVPPGATVTCVSTLGRDADGEYSASADGTPVHWVITNTATGEIIEPA